MTINEELYEYLLSKLSEITANWLDQRTEKENSIYSVNPPLHVENELIDQGDILGKLIAKGLIDVDNEVLSKEISNYISTFADERANSQENFSEVLNQFSIYKNKYWNAIYDFIQANSQRVSANEVFKWSQILSHIMDTIVKVFTDKYIEVSSSIQKSQQQMIVELSSPVIKLSSDIGLLPLIGEIDTYRAKIILESSLEQCSKMKCSHLIIDISGVPIFDTMIAHQLFRVIDSLRLIGVDTIISGMRPELAQTVVQLGIDLKGVHVTRTIENALQSIGYVVREEIR
jgi:rsbT co-antagonist protein RsbR